MRMKASTEIVKLNKVQNFFDASMTVLYKVQSKLNTACAPIPTSVGQSLQTKMHHSPASR